MDGTWSDISLGRVRLDSFCEWDLVLGGRGQAVL